MLDFLIQLDQEIFLFLNQELRHESLDKFWFLISETWVWYPLYAFLIFLLWKTYKKKIWICIVIIALTIACADGFTSRFMKPYFKRPRPSQDEVLKKETKVVKDWNGNEYRGGAYGFASSHAANSFAVAMLMFLLLRNYWRYIFLLFPWALMVSYSRIYLGVHYPLDILVGALLGILFATLWMQLFKKTLQV